MQELSVFVAIYSLDPPFQPYQRQQIAQLVAAVRVVRGQQAEQLEQLDLEEGVRHAADVVFALKTAADDHLHLLDQTGNQLPELRDVRGRFAEHVQRQGDRYGIKRREKKELYR